MQALAAEVHGEWRKVLRVCHLPRPAPGPTECVIQVAFADVNPVDLQKLAEPLGRPVRDPPMVPGYSGSGVVVERGDQVPAEFEDARVAFLANPAKRGCYAEYCVADYRAAAVVPDNVSLKSAAVVPLSGCTACEALVKLGLGPSAVLASGSPRRRKKQLLIVGGAGGVGSWALLLLQAWHSSDALEIIVTTSSEESESWCYHLSADQCTGCIGHDEIKSLGSGPDGSVDYILCLTEPTPEVFEAMSAVIRPRGCICLVGAGPSLQSINLGFCFFKSCCIQTETVFSSFRTNFERVQPADEIAEILQLLDSGKIPAAPLSPALTSEEIEQDWIAVVESEHTANVLDLISTGHTQGKLCLHIAKDLCEVGASF